MRPALSALTFLAFALPARADVIVQVEPRFSFGSIGAAPGQRVTTPAGGPWDNITFNWYSGGRGDVPIALGTLYVLDREYLGLRSGLSTDTPGFLAVGHGVGVAYPLPQYAFDPAFTLQPDTTYWFYSDGNVAF